MSKTINIEEQLTKKDIIRLIIKEWARRKVIRDSIPFLVEDPFFSGELWCEPRKDYPDDKTVIAYIKGRTCVPGVPGLDPTEITHAYVLEESDYASFIDHDSLVRNPMRQVKEKCEFNYTESYKKKINKKVGIRNLELGLLEQGEDSIRVYLFNKVKTILYNVKNPSFSNLDNGEKMIKDKQSVIGYIKKENSYDDEILYLDVSYQEVEELENKKLTHHNRFNMAITDAELIEDIEECIRNAVKRII